MGEHLLTLRAGATSTRDDCAAISSRCRVARCQGVRAVGMDDDNEGGGAARRKRGSDSRRIVRIPAPCMQPPAALCLHVFVLSRCPPLQASDPVVCLDTHTLTPALLPWMWRPDAIGDTPRGCCREKNGDSRLTWCSVLARRWALR